MFFQTKKNKDNGVLSNEKVIIYIEQIFALSVQKIKINKHIQFNK